MRANPGARHCPHACSLHSGGWPGPTRLRAIGSSQELVPSGPPFCRGPRWQSGDHWGSLTTHDRDLAAEWGSQKQTHVAPTTAPTPAGDSGGECTPRSVRTEPGGPFAPRDPRSGKGTQAAGQKWEENQEGRVCPLPRRGAGHRPQLRATLPVCGGHIFHKANADTEKHPGLGCAETRRGSPTSLRTPGQVAGGPGGWGRGRGRAGRLPGVQVKE